MAESKLCSMLLFATRRNFTKSWRVCLLCCQVQARRNWEKSPELPSGVEAISKQNEAFDKCLLPLRSACLMSRLGHGSQFKTRPLAQAAVVAALSPRDGSNSVFCELQKSQSCRKRGQFPSFPVQTTQSWRLSDSATRDWHTPYSRVIVSSSGWRLYWQATYAPDHNLSVCLASFTSLSISNQRCWDWLEEQQEETIRIGLCHVSKSLFSFINSVRVLPLLRYANLSNLYFSPWTLSTWTQHQPAFQFKWIHT